MTIGPYYFYKCPFCGNTLKNRSIMSGNTFGAKFYSDGSRIAPMLPDIPNLTKCNKCDNIVWLSDLEELGEKNVSSNADYSDHPEWRNIDCVKHLQIYDLWCALKTLPKTRKSAKQKQREIFIRQRIWWKYNNGADLTEIDAWSDDCRNFDVGKNLATIDRWYENCRDLLDLLDPKDNDQCCMAAELNRNLCNFSKCLELIKKLPEKYITFKIKMMEECSNINPLTVELNDRERQIFTESYYDILQNEDKKLLFCIREREGEQDKPLMIYEGGDYAILFRRPNQYVILNAIHPGAHEQLAKEKEVLIAEFSVSKNEAGKEVFDKGVVREYVVNVNDCLPKKYDLPENDFKKDISCRLAEKIAQDETTAKNALEFYKVLAEKCNIDAMFALGELYNSSGSGFYNPSEAADWYFYAAVQGHKDAIYELEALENDDDGRYDAWV